MRFGLFHECSPTTPQRYHQRYREMIAEAVRAEEVGFDIYLLSESHFSRHYGISSPEVFLSAVAARTSRIRLRAGGVVVLSFNHPIRVAEQLATLDVLSDGRAELGTVRSNNRDVIEGFEISPKETRAQSDEALEIIAKALRSDPFEHRGTFWNIPSRSLVPRPVQEPHPPMVYCSTGLEGHRVAGLKGLGVMSGGSLVRGWDFVEEAIPTYKDALNDAEPIGAYTFDSLGVYVNRAHCAETMEKAIGAARRSAIETVELVLGFYKKLASASPDYAYMGQLGDIEEHTQDVEYLNERGPFVTVGDPEFFIERCTRLRDLGADEVIFCIDGLEHSAHMRAIELIGERVIPALRNGQDTRTGPAAGRVP